MVGYEVDTSLLFYRQQFVERFSHNVSRSLVNPLMAKGLIVAQGHPHKSIADLLLFELGSRKIAGQHHVSHSTCTLILALDEIHVEHSIHQEIIAPMVDIINVLRRDERQERSGALNDEPIVEHLDKDVHIPEAV